MKIRLGFVSNSSSASYIVDLEEYPNVFSVTKAMLELIIKNPEITLKEDDKEYAKVELELLEQAIKDGIDPELPLFIPGNYDTCIVKKEDRYDINTNFDHPFWKLTGFDGVDYFGYLDDPNMEYYFLYIGKYGTLNDYKTKYSELVGEKHKEIYNLVQNRKQGKEFQTKEDLQESVKHEEIDKFDESRLKEEFKINEYLTLKLKDKYPVIYVKGKEFRHCMRLVLNISLEDVEKFEQIDSIDEASEIYDTLAWKKAYKTGQPIDITPQEEFWGHCSNLQAWVENNYDTRLIHSNLAFPLLKELYEAGDPIAKRVFKEEIVQRIKSGHVPVVSYLLMEGYLKYIDKKEQKNLLYDSFEALSIDPKLEQIFRFLFTPEGIEELNIEEFNINDIYNFIVDLELYDWLYAGIEYLEMNFYNLLKIIFSSKNSRIAFLILLKKKLDEKFYDQILPLIEIFMYKTNVEEINSLFDESLSVFHEIFYTITMMDRFEWYYDVEMWEKVGKSISGLIKNKIQENVIKKNFKEIYKIYQNYLFECLNKQDLISVFSHNKINLIGFLLENANEIYEYESFYDGFTIKGIDEEVASLISESLIKILPNYSFKKYNDPLFALGFFGYLSKDHIKMIIEDPKIDYFKLLISQIYAWEDPDYGRKYVKETFNKVGVNFTEVILPYIKKKDLNIFIRILDDWLWDLFKPEEIKDLIRDKNLKFVENLLLVSHKLAVGEIKYKGYMFESGLIIFPQDFIKQEKQLLREIFKEIIKQKNMDTFVPLYADDLTRYFNNEEICSMIRDKDINLLKLVLTAIDKHDKELYTYRESAYILNEKLLKIVEQNIESSVILDLLRTFPKLNFSPLMENGIIEKLDYDDLILLFKDRNIYKSFILSLQRYIYWFEELGSQMGKSIRYYERLWPYLLKNNPDILQFNNVELYLQIDPYILFDLKILECFGISFTIALLEKADMQYIKKFFKNLRSLELSSPVGSFNRRFLNEITPFLHIVGKYLTPSMKKKILKFLDNYLHYELEEEDSKRRYSKEEIEIVYFLFYLRWNLFFNSDELEELKNILTKNDTLLERIHQKFAEKYGLMFLEHPAPYVLVNYYRFIQKEGVLKLLEKFKPKNVILFLKYLGELTDYVMCPINQYFRMASEEIQSRISDDFKIIRKDVQATSDDEKEKDLDLSNFFNKSVIVHEYAEKPCHFMRGCPYGPLVECFKPRLIHDKSSCTDFGHDCPAFYISEFVNESMSEVPPKDEDLEKLNDNIKNYHWFNNERITVEDINKPCHNLGWCPYGSLGDQFKIREPKNKYECGIFGHDCPVFYHFEVGFG